MAWYFRKSKSFGPFRLNFSKSGVGVSFGVKGARISMNRRGTYVNVGSHGIYYRQRIDGPTLPADKNLVPPPLNPIEPNVHPLHTITTKDVDTVTDMDSEDFVRELESKHNKISLLNWLGIVPAAFIIVGCLSYVNEPVSVQQQYKDTFTVTKSIVNVRDIPSTTGQPIYKAKRFEKFDVIQQDLSGWVMIAYQQHPLRSGFIRSDMGDLHHTPTAKAEITRLEQFPELRYYFISTLLLLLAWCIYLYRVDKRRKTLELYYTLDNDVAALHEKFLAFFREFSSSRRVWQKLHTENVSDKKYNAGASQVISRAAVKAIANHKLPLRYLKTNVLVPYIGLKNTELFFFPERIIVKRGNKFGACFYKNLDVTSENVRFIEEEIVPSDATVTDYTWKYLNKRGGPDKRFKNNRQLPICIYTDYIFKSNTGIHEVITTSRKGGMDNFSAFLGIVGDYQKLN